MKVLIVTPLDSMQTEHVQKQQGIMKMYALEQFGDDIQVLPGWKSPAVNCMGQTCANPGFAAIANVFDNLSQIDAAKGDAVLIGFGWESCRVCQMVKSNCEEYHIPFYTFDKHGA